MLFLRRHMPLVFRHFLACAFFLIATSLWADDVWNGPAFAISPETMRQAAAAIKAEKDADATILLEDDRYTFDRDGKVTRSFHTIYRIENEEAVKGWAETSAHWEPWHEAKPEIRARVITVDGVAHTLDPKTLTDIPVHEDSPDTYTDARSFGGPLPAIAVGAIVEEEIVIRETTLFFAGGTVERLALDKNTVVNKILVVLSHPDSLPFHYILQQMPGAKVKKATKDGIETIEIEDGPYEAREEKLSYLPSDVVPGPQVEFSTGTSWQQMAVEYNRLANDKLRAADVQLALAKIDTKTGTRVDVVRRIVAALHKTVRYTGIEFGESSLVPQFPAETLKRKYGDCKDKATLLATMLRAVNIPANLVLLSTGPGQDVNTELPGMGMFDHAIVYIPAAGADAEMWVDATAQYTRVGDLPFMDYGRWALVVDEKTTALKKIPDLAAAQNFHRETREFTLVEYGPAKIVEKNEQTGPREGEFREYYNGDPKQVRQNSEDYIKEEYLAESLTSLDHGDLSDLEKPFSLTFTAQGKRGNTGYESAVVAIRVEDIMYGMPAYFTTSEKEEAENDNEGSHPDKRKPRTADWEIRPFVNQWDYKITAPPGFKLRALPPAKDEQLGTASFTQKYSSNADGTIVEAVLRFDTGKVRMTVQEAKVLRDAVVKARNSDPIFITFDQIGHALLSAGKIKEGLAAYRQLAQQHPKEALHRIQLARALLSAGLAENARATAREATVLEPSSAQAYTTLAWVLQHDLIGRRFKKGFDYEGAVAAYRKAKTLDPKDKDLRTNLAILLESDAEGTRYSKKAHLKEAIAEFKELKEIDKDYMQSYEDNILYDLWYSHDYKTLLTAVAALPTTDVRKGMMLAAVAADQGAEAAIKKSLEITTEDKGRSTALVNAGALLMRVQKYPETAELFAAGSHGQPNESQFAASVAILSKTKPYQQIKIDPADPRSVMQRFFILIFGGNTEIDDFKQVFSKFVTNQSDFKNSGEFRRAMSGLRVTLASSGLPLETVADIALSNIHFTLEGDDSLGYKITMEAPGSPTQEAYVVREDGQWKLLSFSLSAAGSPEELGWQALAFLQNKDQVRARKWLDWAREKIHISEGDDPLSGQPFPHLWTKGQEGDEAAIRTAALVLLPSKELNGEYLSALLSARDAAKREDERQRLNLVLAYAYAAQQRWVELLDVAEKLMASAPDSYVAFHFAEQACAGLKKLEYWDTLLQARLQKHADDPEYIRSASRLAGWHSQFDKAKELMKSLIDRGKATASDMNGYAWDALLTTAPPDQDAIDTARRANDLTKNVDWHLLHTLACLYAETGKASQARELLLKVMELANMEEPDSEVWFGFGKIAEQYGENTAASVMYGRVDKPKMEYPGTSYSMAQQRLLALKNATSAAAKNAGK